MPLLLLDLDDTLVSRESAFANWARGFTAVHGGQVDWLIEADDDGYAPREIFVEAVRRRLALSDADVVLLQADLGRGMAEYLAPDAAIETALVNARAAGWVPVVVTNGKVAHQERKLVVSGLDKLVAGWVISEAAGVKKPAREIFELAAATVGGSLAGGWMIGDSVHADIAGAVHVGLKSVWLHRGRSWTETEFAPDAVADDCAAAIAHVLATTPK